MRRRELLQLAGTTAGAIALAGTAQARHRPRPRKVRRDVCVLGGGSSGTYAAIHLQDRGASVFLVERSNKLGGHAETFVDPASSVPIDIGVVVLENIDVVHEYFGRFGVPLAPASFQGQDTTYVDFKTGEEVAYLPPDPAATGAALYQYRQLLATQFPYLEDGFQLPDPVPADLIRPFRDFVSKHHLESLFPLAFQYGQGAGNMLDNPALFAMKLFGAAVVDSILGAGFSVVPGGVGALYQAATQALGQDVLLSAKIEHVTRNGRGAYPIEVLLSTPEGPTQVECKKLLVAFPPSPHGFRPFDFDRQEQRLFARLRATHYSTGVVELEGLSPSLSIQNVGVDTTYELPQLPGTYGLNPTGAPGLWNVKYGSPFPVSDYAVKYAIIRDLERMAESGTVPVGFRRFAIFKNHTPFHIQARPSDIARGFYDRLNALQGYRDTFYTGATFQTNDSSQIWRFTKTLLPQLFV